VLALIVFQSFWSRFNVLQRNKERKKKQNKVTQRSKEGYRTLLDTKNWTQQKH